MFAATTTMDLPSKITALKADIKELEVKNKKLKEKNEKLEAENQGLWDGGGLFLSPADCSSLFLPHPVK